MPEQFAYVSLLRGVNVGGHNKIPMRELKTVYEQAGCAAVKTYLQSGNVVFTGAEKDQAVLTKKIENAIAEYFSLAIPVLLKSKKAWRAIIAGNPYAARDGIDQAQLHVALPFVKMTKSGMKKIEEIAAATDEFCIANGVIYLYCPNGYRYAKLTNNRLEKILAAPVTARNFRTVCALDAQLG